LLKIKGFQLGELQKKKVLIVGNEPESIRVSQLLRQTQANPEIIGFISNETSASPEYIGSIGQLEDLISIYKIEEIIFCARDIASQDIIGHMLNLSHIDIEYKIAPPESLSIIGSNSINTAGDLYLINLNTIGRPSGKREKRLFDIISSFLLLIFYPILFLFIINKFNTLSNILKVLAGAKTWVSYYFYDGLNLNELPKIKKGILNPVDGLGKKKIDESLKEKLNFLYAKDYKFTNDMNILIKGIQFIGR